MSLYSVDSFRVNEGRLELLVKRQWSRYPLLYSIMPDSGGPKARHHYMYWLDVDYETVWGGAAQSVRVQPLFRSETDVSPPRTIARNPKALVWGSQWERIHSFDIGTRSWHRVQHAPPGAFVYTGINGGQEGALIWTQGDDLYTYDMGLGTYRRVGCAPQCQAELGDAEWVNSDCRAPRRAAVIGPRTVVWDETSDGVATLLWFDLVSGMYLGKHPVPTGSTLWTLAWNGDSLVFALCDGAGAVSIWTESGPLPNTRQMGGDVMRPIHDMLLTTSPPALVIIKWIADAGPESLQWEIREWRYTEDSYRTGALFVDVAKLTQPPKRFVGPYSYD